MEQVFHKIKLKGISIDNISERSAKQKLIKLQGEILYTLSFNSKVMFHAREYYGTVRIDQSEVRISFCDISASCRIKY